MNPTQKQPTPSESRQTDASPLPWSVESVANPDAEYSEGGPESSKGFDAFQILDAKGRVLFDSVNRDAAASSIMEDHGEEFVDAWDAAARKDAAFTVHCVNSHASHLARIEALERALRAIADEAVKHHEHNATSGKDRLPVGYSNILNIADGALNPEQP